MQEVGQRRERLPRARVRGQNMKSGEMMISLEALEYWVLRFWNHEILIGAKAIPECIHQALIKSPHPNPSP